MNKRCKKCGRNLLFITNNLYRCPNCGYTLVTNSKYLSLEVTDLRRCVLRYSYGFNEVYTYLYQLDLLKLINMAKQLNIPFYIEKFKKFIFAIDKVKQQQTNFTRLSRLPRVYLDKVLEK